MSTVVEMVSGSANGAAPDGGEAGLDRAGLPAEFPVPMPRGAHVEMCGERYVLAYGTHGLRFSCPTLEGLYDVMARGVEIQR